MSTAVSPLFGVNLPWLYGAYGHDMAPNELRPSWPVRFAPTRTYRPFVEAGDLGFGVVRVWLCESGEGIVTRNGVPARPHPQLLESIDIIQECAGLLGIRIYWTLLDANSCEREKDRLTRSILTEPEACARFADGVAAELALRFDPRVTFGVEVVNEIEALSPSCAQRESAVQPWEVLAGSIRRIAESVRAAAPATVVTAGTFHTYLGELFRESPGLDAIDLHFYDTDGGLPSRQQLADDSGYRRILDRSIPLIAGECGIPDHASEQNLPALKNYIYNARQQDYDAVLLWRLDKVLVDSASPKRHVTTLGSEVRAILGQIRCGRDAG